MLVSLAIAALEPLAQQDDQALARLSHRSRPERTPEVRLAALVALESAYDSISLPRRT